MGPDRAKTMSAMMAALLLFFACVARSASACEGGTVADMLDEAIAEGIPFRYLQRALEEDPGLRASLAAAGPVTFYAPIDGAFAGSEGDEFFPSLREIARNHVVASGDQRLEDASFPRGVKVFQRTAACNGELVIVSDLIVPREGAVALARKLLPDLEPGGGQPALPQPSGGCEMGDCCDVAPPGQYDCFTQKKFDKCEESWMVSGGYCRSSCNRCSAMSKKYPRISFDPATQIVGSGILYQRWTNITCETYWEGINMITCPNFWWNTVDTLYTTRADFMKSAPESSEWIRDTGSFQAPAGLAAQRDTATRMTGYFCPQADGDHTFKVSSDDNSRLYIMDADELQNWALSSSKSHYRDYVSGLEPWVEVGYSKLKSQWVGPQRGPKELRKGESVFLEVHHKNGGGPGHLKVGVVLPSGEWVHPIPAYMFDKKCGV